MKKIIAIDFVLENCEVIRHKIIKESYTRCRIGNCRYNYYLQDDWLSKSEFTDFFEFTCDWREWKPEFTNYASPMNAIHRLAYGDITSISFVYDDDSSHQIYVPWKSRGKFPNETNKLVKLKREITDMYDHFILEIDDIQWWRKLPYFHLKILSLFRIQDKKVIRLTTKSFLEKME
jgi:hypothetical protein